MLEEFKKFDAHGVTDASVVDIICNGRAGVGVHDPGPTCVGRARAPIRQPASCGEAH
jgi:hypothetical protein